MGYTPIRRKFVQSRHPLQLMAQKKKIHKKKNHYICQPKIVGCGFWIIGNQIPPANNYNGSYMYFVAMSCNGQVQQMVGMGKFSPSARFITPAIRL